ncbi:hypothetical protein ACFWBM_00550 [Streptomyces sp. NPDC059980]|uniref:hypothetical protein n=1 Tax=Streptomyces sp. NPDC059980 TaxID=3347022 RepID=UPI0036C6B122
MLDPAETEEPLHLDQASCFLSKIELRRGEAASMAPWRKPLFIATSPITADDAEHFSLARDRTVIMGSHIEVWMQGPPVAQGAAGRDAGGAGSASRWGLRQPARLEG